MTFPTLRKLGAKGYWFNERRFWVVFQAPTRWELFCSLFNGDVYVEYKK